MRSVAPYDRRDIFGSFHLVKSPNKVLMLINEKEVNMYTKSWLAHHGIKGQQWGVRIAVISVPLTSRDIGNSVESMSYRTLYRGNKNKE